MSAVCAAGVGGGSLVYLGMTLQPKRSVFNAWFPDALDYSTMDRVHYPQVARMLKANVAPDALINSHAYRGAREFAKRARRAGMPVEKLAARSTGTTRSPRTTDGCGGPTRSATPCSV